MSMPTVVKVFAAAAMIFVSFGINMEYTGEANSDIKPDGPPEAAPTAQAEDTMQSALAEVKAVDSIKGSAMPKRKKVVGNSPAATAFAARESIKQYYKEKAYNDTMKAMAQANATSELEVDSGPKLKEVAQATVEQATNGSKQQMLQVRNSATELTLSSQNATTQITGGSQSRGVWYVENGEYREKFGNATHNHRGDMVVWPTTGEQPRSAGGRAEKNAPAGNLLIISKDARLDQTRPDVWEPENKAIFVIMPVDPEITLTPSSTSLKWCAAKIFAAFAMHVYTEDWEDNLAKKVAHSTGGTLVLDPPSPFGGAKPRPDNPRPINPLYFNKWAVQNPDEKNQHGWYLVVQIGFHCYDCIDGGNVKEEVGSIYSGNGGYWLATGNDLGGGKLKGTIPYAALEWEERAHDILSRIFSAA